MTRIGERAFLMRMVQRTPPRSRTDETAFPVRLKYRKEAGPDWIRWSEAEAWLNENVGRGNWARHGTGTILLYFRSAEAAHRFADRFPRFELLDLTRQQDYLRRTQDGETWDYGTTADLGRKWR